jgi:iron complex outermembrane receptor protein
MNFYNSTIALTLFSFSSIVIAEPYINVPKISVEESKELPFGDTSLDLDLIATKKNLNIDTGDILNDFLGTNSIKNGGFSSLPLLQGLSDDRIKIKIDGIDIISSCANHMNPPLSYTSPANIHDIDVLAGLSSVSQGGDNIGGVINIKSNDIELSENATTIIHGKLQTFYKSNNDAAGLNLSFSRANQDTAVKYFGSFVEANNSFSGSSFKDASLAASDRGYLAGDEIGSTRFKNQNHKFTLVKKDQNHFYETTLSYQDSPYQSFPNQRMDSVGNTNYQINIRHEVDYIWGKVNSQVYYDNTNHKHNFADDKKFTYTSMGSTSFGMPMESDGKTFGVSLDVDYFMSDMSTVKIGAELQLYGLDDKWASNSSGEGMMSGNDFYNINNGERDRFDLYTQLDRDWSTNWLSSVGLRYGLVKTDAGEVQGYNNTDMMSSNQATDSTAFNNSDRSETDHNIDVSILSKFTSKKSSSIEFGYTMKTRSPNLYQRYSWSTWTMAANMNNLYGDGNGYIGNINLKPETAHRIGFLIDHQSPNGDWTFKVNPFYSYINDYIDVENTSASRSDGYRNLKFHNHDVTISGIDIATKRKVFQNTSLGNYDLFAKFNYQRGRNLDNSTDLYNLMPANLSLGLNHAKNNWKNSFVVKLVNKKDNVDTVRQERETSSFAVADFYTSYQLQSFEIVGSIENIFDRMHDNPLGGEYIGQGATMSTGVSRANGSQMPGIGRSINISIAYLF